VYACDIKWGSTTVTHKRWWMEYLMKQMIVFSEVMIENSAWFVGEYMFSNLMGPAMDKLLNHYRLVMPIHSFFKGNTDKEYFTLDYRNLNDPIIEDHHV
jgi:Na+-driven multidrug efflux pump